MREFLIVQVLLFVALLFFVIYPSIEVEKEKVPYIIYDTPMGDVFEIYIEEEPYLLYRNTIIKKD